MIRLCGRCHWFVGWQRSWLNGTRTHALCKACYRRLLHQAYSYGLGQ
jgi:hypothetical protein